MEASFLEPVQLPLVNRFYKSIRYSASAGRGERVMVVRDGAVIVGAVRMQPKELAGMGPAWFLRSMAVSPEYRRKGVGTLMLGQLLLAFPRDTVWCYPFSHLQGFYRLGGFKSLLAEDAPPEIRQPYERYCRQGRDILIMARNLE